MTMFRTALATTLAAALAAALALPAAGAAQASSNGATVTLGAPRLVRTAEGVSLRGAVCRGGPVRSAGRLTASLNRIGPEGQEYAGQPLRLIGAVAGRGPGCAYYDVAVSESDRNLEVCAAAPGAGLSCRLVD